MWQPWVLGGIQGLGTHIIVGRKPTSFPSYADLASILPGSSLSQNSHVLAAIWSYPASGLHGLFARGALGLWAWDGMPKVRPPEEGHRRRKFRDIGVGRLHSIWPGGRRALGTATPTVGLPRPLEQNTEIRPTLPFSFPFLVTQEEQDNVGSRPRGSSHFRPAAPGLGGAAAWEAPRPCTEEPGQPSCVADPFAVRASSLRGRRGQSRARTASRGVAWP